METKGRTFADSYRECVREMTAEIKWEDIRDQVPAGQEFSAALACMIFWRLKKREKGTT